MRSWSASLQGRRIGGDDLDFFLPCEHLRRLLLDAHRPRRGQLAGLGVIKAVELLHGIDVVLPFLIESGLAGSCRREPSACRRLGRRPGPETLEQAGRSLRADRRHWSRSGLCSLSMPSMKKCQPMASRSRISMRHVAGRGVASDRRRSVARTPVRNRAIARRDQQPADEDAHGRRMQHFGSENAPKPRWSPATHPRAFHDS